MSQRPPHRVKSVDVEVVVPVELSGELRDALARSVARCPVHNSIRLAPQVEIAIRAPALVA